MNTEGYPKIDIVLPVSAPMVPAYSPEYVDKHDQKKSKYYKLLSKEYKNENEDLYESGKDILNRNKKIQKKNKVLKSANDELIKQYDQLKKEFEKSQNIVKDINLSLLQEMENNAILESKVVLLSRKLKKKKEFDDRYCYIPKKNKPELRRSSVRFNIFRDKTSVRYY
jgi:hypothetical protein